MKKILRLAFVCFLAGMTVNAAGQISLKEKLKNKANQMMENALKKDNSQQNKQEQQQQTKQEEQPQQQAQEQNSNVAKPSEAEPQTELQSYSKYDFIPGSKVIFYEDFSQDAIGDFPALWNTNGSGEIVTTNLFPGKWLRFESDASVWTDQLLDLPENYTIELDIIPIPGENGAIRSQSYTLMLYQCINVKAFDYGSRPGKAAFSFWLNYGTPSYDTYINLPGGENMGLSGNKEGDSYNEKPNQKYHIAIWIQKARVRLYQEQNKLFDLPKAFNVEGVKMDRIRFDGGAFMVSNIRVAVGAPDTRNKLLTEGKLVTYGIYFDVNKDIVKPESYGTLKDIATVLSENPDVRVKIVGYTDSDGADAANLDLSKRRAASVKDELAKTFNIDASRMETDGMGEASPVAPNDTPVNKALNRRVEFIKL